MLQGESARADRNKVIGVLRIVADKIARDLPVGTEVEVTLSVDESSQTMGHAYVPLLDQRFDDVVLCQMETKQAGEVSRSLAEQKDRLKNLEKLADELGGDGGGADARVAEVEALIEDGDRDSVDLADQMVRMMSVELDQAEDTGRAKAIEATFRQRVAEARELLERHGEQAEKRQLEALEIEFLAAMKKHDLDLAEARSEAVDGLYYRVLMRQPGYWIGFFEYLSKKLGELGLGFGAKDKFDRGRQAIADKAWGTLNEVCMQLLRLLPEKERKDVGPPEVRSHVK